MCRLYAHLWKIISNNGILNFVLSIFLSFFVLFILVNILRASYRTSHHSTSHALISNNFQPFLTIGAITIIGNMALDDPETQQLLLVKIRIMPVPDNIHNAVAADAVQMVVGFSIRIVMHRIIPYNTDCIDHAQFFENVQGVINRRQGNIRHSGFQFRIDLFRFGVVLVIDKNAENFPALRGDLVLCS
jgi:hypothetical protein